MWIVHLFDAADSSVSHFHCGPKYCTVWGEYLMQEEAIEVRNEIIKSGGYAKITDRA